MDGSGTAFALGGRPLRFFAGRGSLATSPAIDFFFFIMTAVSPPAPSTIGDDDFFATAPSAATVEVFPFSTLASIFVVDSDAAAAVATTLDDA
jgi:hypothetical protein